MKAIVARLDAYERLIRLDKPIGILLLLWPTLWGLWLASRGKPGWVMVWVFVLGTVLMRSAGCAINDFADRNFDAHVERTRGRPLATGEIKSWEAIAVAAVLALAAFGLVLMYLNRLSMWLSFGALAIAVLYPFTKRFFVMPQAVLGVAFSFGIPMAYAAVREALPNTTWWLMAATWLWVVAYDTQYAMVDRDDDVKLGLKTSAIWFGQNDVSIVAACYAGMVAILIYVGIVTLAGLAYYAGLVAAVAVAAYCIAIIRSRERARCFKAFLANHWIGAVIFAGVAVDLTKSGRWT